MEFMEIFSKYIGQTKILNHLDISGMGFDPPNLLRLLNDLNDHVDSLVGLHMSDLGINNDKNFANEVLQIFAVEINRHSKLAFLDTFSINKKVDNV